MFKSFKEQMQSISARDPVVRGTLEILCYPGLQVVLGAITIEDDVNIP